MSISVTHTTPADATFSPTGQAAWDAAHAVTGAAASGANSDITSLSGLLTPLSFAQGGTGSTATPGTGQIIFSDGAALKGDTNLTWDATTGLLVQKNVSCPSTAGGGVRNERFGAGTTIGSGLNDCVALGYNASITNADGQIAIGSGAAAHGFTSNIIIGAGASTTRSHTIVIGSSAFTNFDNVSVVGDSASVQPASGQFAIGVFGYGATQVHKNGGIFGSGIFSGADNELSIGMAAGDAGQPFSLRLQGATDAYTGRSLAVFGTAWIDSTDATRKARVSLKVSDTAEREFMRADSTGAAAVNVALLSGGSFITQAAALGTTATDGFLYIPTSAGAPTGTPTAQTGTVATEYDTTNDALKIYNTAWKTIPTQATGSWTPADNSGAALSFTGVSANYTKIGNMVFAYFKLTYPVTASGANASISGLPFTIANADYATGPAIVDTSASITGGLVLVPVKNTTTANLDVGTPVGPVTNLQLSGASIAVMLIYPVT